MCVYICASSLLYTEWGFSSLFCVTLIVNTLKYKAFKCFHLVGILPGIQGESKSSSFARLFLSLSLNIVVSIGDRYIHRYKKKHLIANRDLDLLRTRSVHGSNYH